MEKIITYLETDYFTNGKRHSFILRTKLDILGFSTYIKFISQSVQIYSFPNTKMLYFFLVVVKEYENSTGTDFPVFF